MSGIRAALTYVAGVEPVRVIAAWRAVLVLAAAFGFAVPAGLDARGAAIIAAFYALLEVVSTSMARARVVPTAKLSAGTLERVAGGEEGSPAYRALHE